MGSDLFNFKFSKDKIESQTIGTKSQLEQQLVLSDESFKNLRDVVYGLSGIYFTDSKKYLLESRIGKRLVARNLKSFEDYINYLKSTQSRQELNDLFEAITINETYFFRAEQQFEAFEKIIVPEILKARGNPSNSVFRIWSAASSTGEEPYTLAIIVLDRLKSQFPNVTFQILASDINNSVLNQARKGIYKEYSVRNIPQHLLKKYFVFSGGNYILSDEVKKMVKFMNINLYDPVAMKTITTCDSIFCANVLIYFDIASKQQVVSYLFDSLNKGGYLFIGYSESLHGISKAFKLVHLPKAMAYKKE